MRNRPPQNAGLKNESYRLRFFGPLGRRKESVYTTIVDAQELVCPGDHVDMIGLSLCSLLVHEGINRVVHRRTLDQPVHNLKEGLPQVRRTLLGGGIALALVVAGFVRARIYTGIGCEGTPVRETGDVADLGNELRAKRGTDAVHLHDGRVFRKLGHLLSLFTAKQILRNQHIVVRGLNFSQVGAVCVPRNLCAATLTQENLFIYKRNNIFIVTTVKSSVGG